MAFALGVLTWLIERGDVDGVDLTGLPVAMAVRYDDDEPGSPWTWILYLDEGATEEQRAALEGIYSGRLGGDAATHFPWAWKASTLVGVRTVPIEVDHTQHRQWLRIRDRVSVRIRDAWPVTRPSRASFPVTSAPARSWSRTSSCSRTARSRSATAAPAATALRSTTRVRDSVGVGAAGEDGAHVNKKGGTAAPSGW